MSDAAIELLSRARALLAANDEAGAVGALEQAQSMAPENADVVAMLAERYAQTGRYPQARALLLQFCSRFQPGAASLRQIGGWFFRAGDYAASAPVFERWCELEAASADVVTSADALISLGSARQMMGQNAAAAKCYRAALDADANRADAWSNLGTVHQAERDLERAHEAYSKALALEPGNPESVAGLASVMDLGGDTQSALALLAAHEETAHTNVELAILTAKLLRRTGEAARAQRVAAGALETPNLTRAQAARLSFTLADALDAQDRTDDAFALYARANQQRGARFDAAAHLAFIEHLIEAHGTTAPDTVVTPAAPAPLFIVGMPRSGTTLVEQMLGCHSAVQAMGERRALPPSVAAILPRHERFPYPASPSALTDDVLQLAARRYRQGLPDVGSARWVTDKLPGNFIYAALIRNIFPNARIIHCQRDPLDVGLSLFCNDFAQASLPFAYSLDHIGQYYLHYRKLMAHWEHVDTAPIINVRYEDLVREPREQITRVLSFLDESFEDSVLDFHASKRVALTASNDQVRRPLYTSSIGRASRYEEHLAPLRQLLNQAGEPYGDAW
ncbi:MAG: sulfotransferase [Gammaproteobacteria bacterium]